MKFNGYLRPDGRLGIRNKVLIVALDECCDGIAKRIAQGYPDVVVLTNHYTCMLGGNEETFYQMAGICANPNVAAVLVLAMGCGSIMTDYFIDAAKGCQKPMEALTCIQTGGAKKTVEAGRQKLEQLIAYADQVPRKEGSAADLFIGIKCGGSDTSSGLASNPSVGKAADLLNQMGATTVAGELIELMGCEKQLERRAASPQVAQDILTAISNELARWNVEGAPVESMSIGNCVGGLTTIEEKSFGALHKTGTAPIEGFLQISSTGIDHPHKPGFYLSDVSHLCGGAGTNFAALGVQVVLWTSGAAAFDNELVPVIKVSGNSELINEDIDVDVTGIMTGRDSAAAAGKRIVAALEAVCNGKATATEGYSTSFLTIYQKDIRVEQLLHIKNPHCPMGC